MIYRMQITSKWGKNFWSLVALFLCSPLAANAYSINFLSDAATSRVVLNSHQRAVGSLNDVVSAYNTAAGLSLKSDVTATALGGARPTVIGMVGLIPAINLFEVELTAQRRFIVTRSNSAETPITEIGLTYGIVGDLSSGNTNTCDDAIRNIFPINNLLDCLFLSGGAIRNFDYITEAFFSATAALIDVSTGVELLGVNYIDELAGAQQKEVRTSVTSSAYLGVDQEYLLRASLRVGSFAAWDGETATYARGDFGTGFRSANANIYLIPEPYSLTLLMLGLTILSLSRTPSFQSED